MIYDSLLNIEKYRNIIPASDTIIKILQSEYLIKKESGSYKTDNPLVIYNIVEYETCENKQYEMHKVKADFQIILKGSEKMQLCDPDIPLGEYNEESDCCFQNGKESVDIYAKAGYFSLFFPFENHKPGINYQNTQHVKKVIFKIKCN